MALYVQKFGGTSVGSVERIQQVADKVKGFRDKGHDIVVVVSAMSGETNRLIGMANELQDKYHQWINGLKITTNGYSSKVLARLASAC